MGSSEACTTASCFASTASQLMMIWTHKSSETWFIRGFLIPLDHLVGGHRNGHRLVSGSLQDKPGPRTSCPIGCHNWFSSTTMEMLSPTTQIVTAQGGQEVPIAQTYTDHIYTCFAVGASKHSAAPFQSCQGSGAGVE